MSDTTAPAGRTRVGAPGRRLSQQTEVGPEAGSEAAMLSLEAVLILPLLALALLAVLSGAGVARDVLLVHEAARVGARAAATSSGVAAVDEAVREAAGREVRVRVQPGERRDGDLAVVVTSTRTRFGPFTRDVDARAVARVEPGVRP